MSTLLFISYTECVPCCQRALIGIVHRMTSGTQQGSNVTDPFASPFSIKEFHGKGCVAKPRKQRRTIHTKNTKHLTDRKQLFTSKSISAASSAVTPLDKGSPVISRRLHSKRKGTKSTRSFKSPSEDDSSISTTSSISPIFGLTSYRFMMHKEVKRAWEDRNAKELCRTPLSFKGKSSRSVISMEFRTGIRAEPFAKSHRRYLHSRPTNVEDVGKELGRGRYKHVIVLSGAGISTPSGIPDFRLF